jgi:hypothetical protein
LTLDELMSRPIIGGCFRPNNVSSKLTTPSPKRANKGTGLLIVHLNASSKVLVQQREILFPRTLLVAKH